MALTKKKIGGVRDLTELVKQILDRATGDVRLDDLEAGIYGPLPAGASPTLRATRRSNTSKLLERTRRRYGMQDRHGRCYRDGPVKLVRVTP